MPSNYVQVFSARLIVIGQNDNLGSLKPAIEFGPPLPRPAMVAGGREVPIPQMLGALLALDDDNGVAE